MEAVPINLRSDLWASGNKCFAGFVALVFCEVLDESSGEVFCFLFPVSNVCVCIAWVEDLGVNARKLGRNFEVEVRDLLCRSV